MGAMLSGNHLFEKKCGDYLRHLLGAYTHALTPGGRGGEGGRETQTTWDVFTKVRTLFRNSVFPWDLRKQHYYKNIAKKTRQREF